MSIAHQFVQHESTDLGAQREQSATDRMGENFFALSLNHSPRASRSSKTHHKIYAVGILFRAALPQAFTPSCAISGPSVISTQTPRAGRTSSTEAM
jgi:hypothetical protein